MGRAPPFLTIPSRRPLGNTDFHFNCPKPEAGSSPGGEELGIRDPLQTEVFAGDVPGPGVRTNQKGMTERSLEGWGQTAPPVWLHCCVTLGSLIHFSGPQFPHL